MNPKKFIEYSPVSDKEVRFKIGESNTEFVLSHTRAVRMALRIIAFANQESFSKACGPDFGLTEMATIRLMEEYCRKSRLFLAEDDDIEFDPETWSVYYRFDEEGDEMVEPRSEPED